MGLHGSRRPSGAGARGRARERMEAGGRSTCVRTRRLPRTARASHRSPAPRGVGGGGVVAGEHGPEPHAQEQRGRTPTSWRERGRLVDDDHPHQTGRPRVAGWSSSREVVTAGSRGNATPSSSPATNWAQMASRISQACGGPGRDRLQVRPRGAPDGGAERTPRASRRRSAPPRGDGPGPAAGPADSRRRRRPRTARRRTPSTGSLPVRARADHPRDEHHPHQRDRHSGEQAPVSRSPSTTQATAETKMTWRLLNMVASPAHIQLDPVVEEDEIGGEEETARNAQRRMRSTTADPAHGPRPRRRWPGSPGNA